MYFGGHQKSRSIFGNYTQVEIPDVSKVPDIEEHLSLAELETEAWFQKAKETS